MGLRIREFIDGKKEEDMTAVLKRAFDERLKEAIALIKSYGIKYERIGVFGSYARGTFKGSSDIDICLVVTERPPRRISGELREICEMKGGDVDYVSPDNFENSSDRFAVQLRRDWRELDVK